MSAPRPGEPDGNRQLLRASVSGLAFPVAGSWHKRRSWDLIRLYPVAGPAGICGRIGSSRRLPVAGYRDSSLIRELTTIIDDELADMTARLDAKVSRTAVAQSASITVTAGAGYSAPDIRLLVRVETQAGPLVAGGTGPCAVDNVLDSLAPLPYLAGLADRLPAGWRDRPLLLHPSAAAPIMVGARLALGSPGAARLTGRRILPDLTLIDEPTGHLGEGHDDDGITADPVVLVDRGRIKSLARDPRSGLPVGRACWEHDGGRLSPSSAYRLVLSGTPAPVAQADNPLDLAICIAGLRPFHADGQLRLMCLAGSRDTDSGSGAWFALHLAARPLALLRAALGTLGPAADTCTDGEVRTPALLLPSINELNSHTDGSWNVNVTPV